MQTFPYSQCVQDWCNFARAAGQTTKSTGKASAGLPRPCSTTVQNPGTGSALRGRAPPQRTTEWSSSTCTSRRASSWSSHASCSTAPWCGKPPRLRLARRRCPRKLYRRLWWCWSNSATTANDTRTLSGKPFLKCSVKFNWRNAYLDHLERVHGWDEQGHEVPMTHHDIRNAQESDAVQGLQTVWVAGACVKNVLCVGKCGKYFDRVAGLRCKYENLVNFGFSARYDAWVDQDCVQLNLD